MLGVNGATHYRKLTSGCPCEGMTVEDSGCTKKITCNFGDDLDSSVSVTFPCPIVYDPEPKYPLVKMLTGILIEWKQGSVEVSGGVPGTLTYKAPLGKNAPTVVGAEIIEGLSFEITISSVYVGSIWDEAAANAITNGKDALDRVNTAYKLLGGNSHVTMLTSRISTIPINPTAGLHRRIKSLPAEISGNGPGRPMMNSSRDSAEKRRITANASVSCGLRERDIKTRLPASQPTGGTPRPH